MFRFKYGAHQQFYNGLEFGFGVGGGTAEPPAPSNLEATIVAGPQVNLAWSLNSIADATDQSIERRDTTAGGAFAQIALVGDGTTEVYAGDVGPFTAKHRYAYRIVIVGGASDGLASNQVAVFSGSSFNRWFRRMHN